jgi:type I restriction enzyme S subunit
MALTKHKLGEFTELYNERCKNPNLTVYDISGVNADKEFFEPSKQAGADTSNYKNVPPDYFACNLMHVGRDKVLPIALNHSGKTKVVSPAYTIFRLKEGTPLLREYFFMMLKSEERDRYFWFHTDSSVRDGMSWDDFCDLEIDIPPISIQKKYVDVYNAMLANQQSYERGLEDLNIVCEALLEKYKRDVPRSPLGELISEVDARNVDGKIESVQGVNKDKQFMPSVASSSDILKYKIVSTGQFAVNLMHVGRDVAIPVAVNTGEPIIVSPAYTVFEVSNKEVSPEFVLMWLSRSETDRLAWFMSDTNVRSGMEKTRFYEIEIPKPSLAEQNLLVEIFQAMDLRKHINDRLKERIKNMCPILIKGSLEEAGV